MYRSEAMGVGALTCPGLIAPLGLAQMNRGLRVVIAGGDTPIAATLTDPDALASAAGETLEAVQALSALILRLRAPVTSRTGQLDENGWTRIE